MKIQARVLAFIDFVNEVGVELKKSVWPTRPELLDSTVVIVLSVLGLGVFIGVSDFILVRLINILL